MSFERGGDSCAQARRCFEQYVVFEFERGVGVVTEARKRVQLPPQDRARAARREFTAQITQHQQAGRTVGIGIGAHGPRIRL